MKPVVLLIALIVSSSACGDTAPAHADGSVADDAARGDGGADGRMPDPADPVEDVPAYAGAYSFGKLTTDDLTTSASSGTWFNDDVTQHKVTDTRVHYARYRDGVVLQSKIAAQILIYDQATTTVGAPITLPSDAVGRATIRGGLVYIGGLGKVYSYEVATQMWRTRDLPGAGTCHHVAAGRTRLFVVCANPTQANTDELYSTWANTTMSDVVPAGSVSPGEGADSSWITAAPGGDVAYFASRTPDQGCVGKVTVSALEPCAFSLRALLSTTVYVNGAQASEDGATLYVTAYGSTGPDNHLYEVTLATPQARSIRTIDSFATCPDNSVVFQDGTLSQRRAGGVTTDVRLGFGGQADMGCPLKKL
jgi:hypothetical protein